MNKYLCFSYQLNEALSAYGNGEPLVIDYIKSIEKGDTSNSCSLKFSNHLGTHIDYPYHFCMEGKKSSDFRVDEHIFDKIGIIEIDLLNNDDVILNENLVSRLPEIDENTEFLIVKTNFCRIRNKERYWRANPGFHPQLANKLKNRFKFLRGIGFDSISLSSYTDRELGRKAHVEFLCKNKILIVEDMNLSELKSTDIINKLFVIPLLLQGMDAAPVTILAEVNSD